MPGDQRDGRRLQPAATPAAKALDQVLKGHVALAPYEQAHGISDRTVAALQLNDALRPIRELVRQAELWRVHPPIQIRERTENKI